MRLHPFQQKIITYLEPLPTGFQDSAKVGLVGRGQLRLSDTVIGILRRLRQREPMIWDPWILKDGDVYRLFYLQGVEGHTPWWTVSKICGAISTDLEHWQDLGTLLEANPAHDWESGRICAGCAYEEDGVYYLFYSAGGKEMPHLRNEAIGLATSTDGLHFSRYSDRPLSMPEDDDPWYGRSNWTGHFHWRDPYIFKDETGNYYMFVCASSNISSKFQGCVGLAVADKITGPYNLLPPVVEFPADALENWPYYHMERPQVIYRNGRYHLFFSCFKMFLNQNWLKTLKHNRITNSSLYWYVADKITGPYEPVNRDNFVVLGSEKTGMYGTNFLQISTEPEEYIAYGWYHRLHALEISPAFRVIWNNYNPNHNSSARLNGDRRQQSELNTLRISLSTRQVKG